MMSATSPSEAKDDPLEENGHTLYAGAGASPSVDSGFSGSTGPGGSIHDLTNGSSPTPEPTAEEREAWERELGKVEEEMRTLRQVLQAKLRRSYELKRKLGITQMDEIKSDINYTLKTIQESDAYAKTTATLKTAGQKTGVALSHAGNKTGEALSTAGTSLRGKLGEMKNSPSFQSFGASVGSTWGSLKRQVSTSMRGSQSTGDLGPGGNVGGPGGPVPVPGPLNEPEMAVPATPDS